MLIKSSNNYERYHPIGRKGLDSLPQIQNLDQDERTAMKVVSAVLPFRTNTYVLNELIDWDNIPDDPIYQLTFPQRDMLDPEDFNAVADLISSNAPREELKTAINKIRCRLNPHPAGQKQHNVPTFMGEALPGMQHKYGDTVLFFPSQGQTCHAYCTYCFRWAQFVGMEELRFQSNETEMLHSYLRQHTEISDILFTGGDPMVMRTKHLRSYIEPLLRPEFEHIRQIRIGTKALAFWPQRFVEGEDAEDFLRLLEEIRRAGRLPAIMAHFSHSVEMSPAIARKAMRRIQDAGGVIRSQAPLIRHVNDSSSIWAELWSTQISLGCVPYYMFVERDTGPKGYFEVPLARALRIYQRAYRTVTGLARTVRGPVMSALPGKVLLTGVTEIHGEKVFALHLLRGRKPEWERQPFFASYDEEATWLTDLEPAFGQRHFFYQKELKKLLKEKSPRRLRDRKKMQISSEFQSLELRPPHKNL